MKSKVILIIIIIGILVLVGFSYWYIQDTNKKKNNLEGENVFNKEEYINEINQYVENIKKYSEDKIQINDTLITQLEMGQTATDFMNALQVNEIPATVKVFGKEAITINPVTDFLDIANYYYKDGKLVMYSCEFIGIGGMANYYFKDGKLIDITKQVEEDMIFTPEDASIILKRADAIYQKYITEIYYSVTLPNKVNLKLGLIGDIESIINSEIVKKEENDTDWPNTKVRSIKYEGFSIMILLNDQTVNNKLIKISTTSDKLILGKGGKIGDTLGELQALYNNQLIKSEMKYSGKDYEICKYDEVYEYDDRNQDTRYLTFYFNNKKLVGLEALDALDG